MEVGLNNLRSKVTAVNSGPQTDITPSTSVIEDSRAKTASSNPGPQKDGPSKYSQR